MREVTCRAFRIGRFGVTALAWSCPITGKPILSATTPIRGGKCRPTILYGNSALRMLDKDLQQKGWQKVESGGDVVIMAVGSTQTQQEYQTFYDGLGGWRWGGFETATTTPITYRVGTLVLDMYDASNKQLLFRGVAENTLSNKPEKNEKSLEKAVDKMFKKFPPEKG